MNNPFLKELAQKPIANTFKLAFKMFLSNKFLFTIVTIMFTSFAIIQFVVPLTFGIQLAEISMVLMIAVILFMNSITQIFTQANYLYICKMLLDSSSEEECVDTMASTMVATLFTHYFVRAIGSSFAIVLMVLPFITIREELNMGAYWDMFLMLLLLLALYVYPLVAHKVTLSKNMKEAFIATFSFFSPSVWKQSFNLSYAKFVISMIVILSGIYYLLNVLIEYVSEMSNIDLSIVMMLIMTIFSTFIMLYLLPIAMMISQKLSKKKEAA